MCKNKTCFPVGIALILGLLIGFGLHPANGLTDLGARVLAVTIPTLYLWLTVNTGWCALLFLGLLILTGAMTPTEVWAGSMGHFAVITMIVFSILNYALKETGVIDRTASWSVSRRIGRGRPLVFPGLFFLFNLVIGMAEFRHPQMAKEDEIDLITFISTLQSPLEQQRAHFYTLLTGVCASCGADSPGGQTSGLFCVTPFRTMGCTPCGACASIPAHFAAESVC